MVDAFETTFGGAVGNQLSDYDKGNVKARARMTAQYAVASQFDLLVIGTDHAAEAVMGFFTKHGDGAADVLPLAGLNKRQGRAILRLVNAPEIFITKQPTADLLDNTPGQADEAELDITYDQIDDYLEGKDIEADAARTIEARFVTTRHKRALPVAFGA
jgi:NAD+ synthase